MEINQAKPTDLIEILYLLKVCIKDLNAKGLKHWNSAFPEIDVIQSDLENGFVYLAKDKGVCKAMISLSDRAPADYKDLSFNTPAKKPLYIQNLAVHPMWQGMGIAIQMVNFAQKIARDRGNDCLRLDIFKPDDEAKQLCEKELFREVASFHSSFQKIPFICYEKQL